MSFCGFFFSVFMLYVAWERGLPWKFSSFVLLKLTRVCSKSWRRKVSRSSVSMKSVRSDDRLQKQQKKHTTVFSCPSHMKTEEQNSKPWHLLQQTSLTIIHPLSNLIKLCNNNDSNNVPILLYQRRINTKQHRGLPFNGQQQYLTKSELFTYFMRLVPQRATNEKVYSADLVAVHFFDLPWVKESVFRIM